MNPTVLGFILKEARQTLRDKRMAALLVVAPILQMLAAGYAIRTDLRNIRLGLVAAPGDRVAARLADRAFATGYFLPARVSARDPIGDLKRGRADAILVAPAGGVTRAVTRGGGQVQLLVDATNAVRARSIEFYLSAVAADALAREGRGVPPAPISLDVRVLYNPAMESALFMVPALAVLVIAEVLILLTAMAIAKEKEMGTMEMLLAAPIGRWEILAGKTIPYFVMSAVNAPIVISFGILWFGVPVRGPLWMLLLAAIVFALSTASLGTLVSTLARNQQQAMIGGFMVMLPAMMLSGVFFPLENMPGTVSWLGWINPLAYFVTLMRNIILKGGDPGVFWSNLLPMAAIAAAVGWVAVRRFRQTLN